MAKKRNAGAESSVTNAGPAPVREHRRRNKMSIPVSSPDAATAGGFRTDTAVESAQTASPMLSAGAAVPDRAPEYQEVARLAYSYWEARGCQGGSPEEDWLRAERELRGRSALGAQA